MYMYETIADTLARSIERGQLPAGTRLASIRDYARTHGVSLNSVKSAYQLLEDKGLITARTRSGYFVCDSLPALQYRSPIEAITDHQQAFVHFRSEADRLLAALLNKRQQGTCIDLALACPVGEKFYPTQRLKTIMTKWLRESNVLSRYALPPGSLTLRTQIARRGLQLGMALDAERILLTHGAMEALSLAVQAATQLGDAVGIETPTFYSLYPLLESLGRRIVSLPTHPQHGLCLDTLPSIIEQQALKAIITIPTGHNPLGFTVPVSARRQLVDIAHRYQLAIIEDALYAELQLGDQQVPNIKAFDREGWVMVCASYGKTLAPDFRIGWLEAGRFTHQAQQLKFATTVAEPLSISETVGIFLENGGYDAHLRQLRRRYDRQIAMLRALIADSFPVGTRVSQPQAGFILWVELPEGIDALALCEAALKEDILCMPGALCARNPSFNHCLRMAACVEMTDTYQNSVRRLGALAAAQRI